MYKIFADGTLIYDSTAEDYKIGKGSGVLETNKAGSFTFSVYPEHFYYDRFVKKKTVILVTKSDKVIFRGRVLDDKDDFGNRREIICEGELNFLQDSIIRPYSFQGTPEEAFVKFVTEHNAQVDEFKRFKIGQVTVLDPNNYIARSNSGYENALKNLTSRLLEDSTGGYLHITHGDDGKDPIPTLHYLADFTEISSQTIEFGSNLKDYLKKGSGQAIATAIIPLGAKIEDGDSGTEDPRLTIASVNDGVDYVYDEAAVAAHGWIFDTVIFDDVTVASNLKAKGDAELAERIREDITVELTAVDLHLLNRSIESFRYDTYIRAVSVPHKFAQTLLCHKQTFDLLKPQNDTITLGSSYSTFTGTVAKTSVMASQVTEVRKDVNTLNLKTNRYKITEQRLTSLLAQSFGVFKTEEVLEDGSTVHYMHDKPTLAESTNIWKMTGDAFAVSSDGGATWNAGMDASGNAIMNILSVIGIDANWINADNLTAISANLGGWKVNEGEIYKELIDEDNPNLIFRIHIRVPESNFLEIARVVKIFEFEISEDGGKTFESAFSVQGQGNIYVGDLNSSFANVSRGAVTEKANGYGWCSQTWAGIEVMDDDDVSNASPRAYFRRRNPSPDSVVDLYADGSVRSGDGVSSYFDFGFASGAFRMVFNGGVLVDAYYI